MTIKTEFINRKDDLKYLEKEFKKQDFRFISIIGRRRLGKTRLIEEFLKNKKNSVYFLIPELNDLDVRLSITEKLYNVFNIPFIGIPDWDEIFRKIFAESEKKRIILTIDEFQRFLKVNKSVPSILQKYIDKYARNSKIFLVVAGSSIGMMHKLFDYASPLYGRRTGKIYLQELNFFTLKEWFPTVSIKTLVEIYAIYGGTPKYLEDVEYPEIMENINKIFSKKSILYGEPELLIKTEFTDSRTYFGILKHIAQGKTKSSEIANASNIKTTSINYFLDILTKDMDIIKREIPVTERRPEKSKKALYFIKDNFFRFWFKFIYPNISEIEMDNISYLLEKVKNELNAFVGMAFEDVCKEFLMNFNNQNKLRFKFDKIGRWWGFHRVRGERKELEIDLVALNKESKEIAFFECKWKNLKQKEALKILGELKKKSGFVDWNSDKRKEVFGLIAKKIKNKKQLRKEGYMVFDLEDF